MPNKLTCFARLTWIKYCTCKAFTDQHLVSTTSPWISCLASPTTTPNDLNISSDTDWLIWGPKCQYHVEHVEGALSVALHFHYCSCSTTGCFRFSACGMRSSACMNANLVQFIATQRETQTWHAQLFGGVIEFLSYSIETCALWNLFGSEDRWSS